VQTGKPNLFSGEETADAVKKCKTKLMYQAKIKLPENWLGKDRALRLGPEVQSDAWRRGRGNDNLDTDPFRSRG
jgi:hypothetical protein